MSGPYDQEKYERAKKSLLDPSLPEKSRKIREERISQYENDRARGYLPAPAAKIPEVEEATANALGGMNSWLANSNSDTANVVRSAMEPDQLAARRAAVDWSKKLTTDERLKTASKLKVFDTPPDFTPPSLPGSPLSSLSALKPAIRYFEPTVNEFRAVLAENKTLANKLREQNPDVNDLAELPDSSIESSDAFKVYADARWQHAYADAVKSRTPIKRVAFTDSDWMGGGQVIGDDGTPKVGDRKASLADLMDGTSALATGVLQGGTFGAYDLALTALGADQTRDQGRGSMDRHPVLGIGGEIYGAIGKHGGPTKLARAISGVGKPTSLAGRATKAGAAGAATALIDENARAAARLAADALDAQDTAAEALARIQEGLPGFSPSTVALGTGIGAGADLLGAGAGALAKDAPRALGLKAPLQNLEASGGQVNALGTPKLSLRAQAYANRAGKNRTTAQDMISESAVQPMARQVMLEQEAAKRAAELETNVAQAGIEGRVVPASGAASAIRADAAVIRPITRQALAQKRELEELAERLTQHGDDLNAQQLDEFIEQLDHAAKQGQANKEPIEHLNNASRHLRTLRDRLGSANDDVTIADALPQEDRGLFTVEVDPTLVEASPRNIAGIRDAHGNVKPVEGYSELKARQYRQKTLQEFKNARALGGGDVLPQTLSAEPVIVEDVVDKGLFNTKTPEELVSGATPKVKLSLKQHNAIKQNIRKLSIPDNLEDSKEVLGLASRVGPAMERKLRVIQQLDDADTLASALGQTINGVSARGGNVGAFFDKKQLFRLVPSLSAMSGGLPKKGPASADAVNRLKQFIKLRVIGAGDPVPASPVDVMPRLSSAELASHREAVQAAARAVSPQEAEAVRRFTRGYDQSIRDLQRGASEAEVAAKNPRGIYHAREALESLPHLESYVKKMPPAREVPYVYRGITLSQEDAAKLLKDGVIQADPTGKAVTSVSADPIVARSFVARNLEPGQVGIQLKLKHRSAVGTAPFSDGKMKVEKELLLPGSARFRVVKRYADKTNPGQYIIEAEEIAGLGESAAELAQRVPKAAAKGAAGFKAGLTSKEKQSTFMPTLPTMNLRAGLPARAIGAARDDSDESTPDFSPEEEDFWMKVIDNLTKGDGK